MSYLTDNDATVLAETENPRSVAVLASVADIETLNQAPLSPEQTDTLLDGGVLVWGEGGSEDIALTRQQDAPAPQTEPLPAWRGDFNPSWQTSLGGAVMLADTAGQFDIEPSRSHVVLTGLSEQQVAATRSTVLEAGWSRQFVRVYDVPDEIGIPAAVWVALGAVAVLLLGTVYALTRTQTAVMRRYAAGLMAIGVPSQWVRGSFLLQWTVIIGCGLILGSAVAVLTVATAALQVPGVTFSVPVAQVTGLILGTAGAGLLGTFAASRRLRVGERDITIG